MDLRIFTEPQQGASHAALLAVARATREHGFSAFFRSDHVLAFGRAPGLPGPSESLVSLAALAAQVPDIRLGTLVTSATFRHPSMLAIAAANLDDISGGRLDLGLGSGWLEAEHRAYGLPFGTSFGDRFDRLTEQLEILTGLWGTPIGQNFSYSGRHYELVDAPALPKPVQRSADGMPKVPLVLGGTGPRRTPALAARFADEFNVAMSSLGVVRTQFDRVRAACELIGRDPDSIVYSAAVTVAVGSSEGEAARRAGNIGREFAEMRSSAGALAGGVAEVIDQLAALAAAGVQRAYLQLLDLTDLEHIALIGEAVRPAVSAA